MGGLALFVASGGVAAFLEIPSFANWVLYAGMLAGWLLAQAKISSPDELDVVLRIVPPTSWFALVTFAGLIVAVVLWGYFGQIPIITQGPGVLLAR